MDQRHTFCEIAKHLVPKDLAQLAQVCSKFSSELKENDYFWLNLYRDFFFNQINFYDTYRENFALAWKMVHPKYYTGIYSIHDGQYGWPILVLDTDNLDLVADKLIELYNSEQYIELNVTLNASIHNSRPYRNNIALQPNISDENIKRIKYTDCDHIVQDGIKTTKLFVFERDVMKFLLTHWQHDSTVASKLPVYEYPGREANKTEISCLICRGSETCIGIGAFSGTDDINEIVDMMGFLFNEYVYIPSNNRNTRLENLINGTDDDNESDYDEYEDEIHDLYLQLEKYYFKDKWHKRCIENEDIAKMLDSWIKLYISDYIFEIKKLPLVHVAC